MLRVSNLRALILLAGGLLSALAFAKPGLDQTSLNEISERIAPVGSVCQAGEECASATGVVASASNSARSGEAVYGQFCTACHTTGLLNAPKKGDSAAWAAKETAAGGFSNLLSNAIKGVGAMPPKGTCMDCSDDEISNAIQYMSGLKP